MHHSRICSAGPDTCGSETSLSSCKFVPSLKSVKS